MWYVNTAFLANHFAFSFFYEVAWYRLVCLASGSSVVYAFLESRHFSCPSPFKVQNKFRRLLIKINFLRCFTLVWGTKAISDHRGREGRSSFPCLNYFPQWTVQSFPHNNDEADYSHKVYEKDVVQNVLISGAKSWDRITHICLFPTKILISGLGWSSGI